MKKLIPVIILSLFSLFACNQQPAGVVYSGTGKSAILDNMITRRAIRKYTTQQVSKAQIDTIMKYSMYAPSALNKQPWEIRIVQNKQWLAELNNRFLKFAEGKTFQGSAANYKKPGFSIFHSAPTLIVIARDKNNPISYLDCGIILQNILLSAHAIGLGTCPLGTLVPVMNRDENRDLLEVLNIPSDYEVAINISLGYPDENPPVKERYADKIKIID